MYEVKITANEQGLALLGNLKNVCQELKLMIAILLMFYS